MPLEELQKVLFMEFRDEEGRCLDLPTQSPLSVFGPSIEFHLTREGFLEEVILPPPHLPEGQTQREKKRDLRRDSAGFKVASSEGLPASRARRTSPPRVSDTRPGEVSSIKTPGKLIGVGGSQDWRF